MNNCITRKPKKQNKGSFLKVIPSFFKTITIILGCQLLTNKIDIVRLFGVLGGSKDGFKFEKASDADV